MDEKDLFIQTESDEEATEDVVSDEEATEELPEKVSEEEATEEASESAENEAAEETSEKASEETNSEEEATSEEATSEEVSEEETSGNAEENSEVAEEGLSEEDREWMKKIRFKRSFTAKLILGDKTVKSRYATLATELLSYEKVTSRSKWACVNFSCGRKPVAKINFAGKTLCVYLALDATLFAASKFKPTDLGHLKKYEMTPARFKVTSDGAFKIILSAIEKVFEELGVKKRAVPLRPVKASDFPKESLRSLLSRGLVKEVKDLVPPAFTGGNAEETEEAEAPENKEYFSDINGKSKPVVMKADELKKPVGGLSPFKGTSKVGGLGGPTTSGIPEESPDWMKKIRYNRSFTAKLILSDKIVKGRYAALATELLSFEKFASKTRWSAINFSCGRKPVAKIAFAGKTLCIYLAIDPALFIDSKYKATDVGHIKKYAQTPARFKIKSDGALRAALAAIDKVAESVGAKKREPQLPPVTAADFPKESINNLISRGLIKAIEPKKILVRTVTEYVEEPPPDIILQEEKTSDDAYEDAIKKTSSLIARHEAFVKMMGALSGDEFNTTFSKKFLIETIDERWVSAVEDALPALDEVIRTPSHFIEESEELLPIERTKKVTLRSIQHLSQHTGLISRIEDGVVIPSKLLNIFRDDSLMTYENKFLNTLIQRLYEFVGMRFDSSKDGANRKVTEFVAEGRFIEGENTRGKITVTMELNEPNEEGEGKNYAYQTDLYKRAERLYEIVRDYQGSGFVASMGNAFIRPPVMRTNAILKNKNMRQCLELWDFIEGYEDEGGIVADSEELYAKKEFVDNIRSELCEQFLVFKHNANAKGVDFKQPQKTEKPADNAIIGQVLSENEEEKPAIEFAFDGGSAFGGKITVSDEEMEKLSETELFAMIAAAADDVIDSRSIEERAAIKAERERLIAAAEREKTEINSYTEPVVSAVDNIPAEADERVTPLYEKDNKSVVTVGDEEIVDEYMTDEEGKKFRRKVAYKKSLTAKLCLADDHLKEHYCTIYNFFAAKEGVTIAVDFNTATFTFEEKTLAKISMYGRNINIFLALDPMTLESKYAALDVGAIEEHSQTPTLVRVYDALTLKFAEELLARVCEGIEDGGTPIFMDTSDYPYEPISALIEAQEVFVREVSPYEEVPEVEPEEEKEPENDKEPPKILFDVQKPEDLSADYREAALEQIRKEKPVKGIKVDLEGLASSSEIKKTIDQVDDEEEKAVSDAAAAAKAAEEAAEEAARAAVQLEGAGGDALHVRKEAFAKLGGDTNAPILELIKKEEEKPAPEPEKPKTVPAGGDVLIPKPITLEELDAMMRESEKKRR